ncbi:pirin family protein [Cellulomonas hominis]
MTNLEARPGTTECRSATEPVPVSRLLEPREVPLGGLRAMRVRRTLPQRGLPMVGAWCFLDEFGPERVDMRVLPHPHTGLQTVTWPFAGEIRHRDSVDSDVVVRPGQLDLMTAGRGVAHSELSLGTGPGGETPFLHAVQLWTALPAAVAGTEPRFEQCVDLPVVAGDGVDVTVFVGELDGAASPARVHSPLLGAEVRVAPGGRAQLPLRPGFEHAVLVVEGVAEVAGRTLGPGPLLYLGSGRDHVDVGAAGGGDGETSARLVLLGGEPFEDDLVMWWNFVGRSHADIAQARADWERDGGAERFGTVPGHDGERVPAPELPNIRLAPRNRPGPDELEHML